MKDRTEQKYKSNVVYRFVCPGCKASQASHVGKTERKLIKGEENMQQQRIVQLMIMI